MNLIAIDIGGTTIKIATWINQKLKMAFTIDTPDNLDTFYEELTDAVNEIKANHNIDGVAISSPGAVNKATGVIEGASALPYIHNFKIVPELEKRFGLPVSIENDANCAALAEIADGAAKGCSSMAFLVIPAQHSPTGTQRQRRKKRTPHLYVPFPSHSRYHRQHQEISAPHQKPPEKPPALHPLPRHEPGKKRRRHINPDNSDGHDTLPQPEPVQQKCQQRQQQPRQYVGKKQAFQQKSHRHPLHPLIPLHMFHISPCQTKRL